MNTILLQTIHSNFIGWLVVILFGSYFLLIHLGMAAWVVTMLKKLIKLDFSINFSWTKIITSLYGGIGGFCLAASVYIFEEGDEPIVTFYGNLLAIIISGKYDSDEAMFFIPYVVLGIIGGWGLGLFFHSLSRFVKRTSGK